MLSNAVVFHTGRRLEADTHGIRGCWRLAPAGTGSSVTGHAGCPWWAKSPRHCMAHPRPPSACDVVMVLLKGADGSAKDRTDSIIHDGSEEKLMRIQGRNVFVACVQAPSPQPGHRILGDEERCEVHLGPTRALTSCSSQPFLEPPFPVRLTGAWHPGRKGPSGRRAATAPGWRCGSSPASMSAAPCRLCCRQCPSPHLCAVEVCMTLAGWLRDKDCGNSEEGRAHDTKYAR